MIDHRSSIHNLSRCEIKARKKFRLERDSNPWLLRYRCSALPTELSSQLVAGHVVSSGVIYPQMVKIQVNIWNIISLNCGERYEDITDHRSYIHNLSSCVYVASNVGPFSTQFFEGSNICLTKWNFLPSAQRTSAHRLKRVQHCNPIKANENVISRA